MSDLYFSHRKVFADRETKGSAESVRLAAGRSKVRNSRKHKHAAALSSIFRLRGPHHTYATYLAFCRDLTLSAQSCCNLIPCIDVLNYSFFWPIANKYLLQLAYQVLSILRAHWTSTTSAEWTIRTLRPPFCTTEHVNQFIDTPYA
jgi:hypothetical protein